MNIAVMSVVLMDQYIAHIKRMMAGCFALNVG
jgi:hypothetical protein